MEIIQKDGGISPKFKITELVKIVDQLYYLGFMNLDISYSEHIKLAVNWQEKLRILNEMHEYLYYDDLSQQDVVKLKEMNCDRYKVFGKTIIIAPNPY